MHAGVRACTILHGDGGQKLLRELLRSMYGAQACMRLEHVRAYARVLATGAHDRTAPAAGERRAIHARRAFACMHAWAKGHQPPRAVVHCVQLHLALNTPLQCCLRARHLQVAAQCLAMQGQPAQASQASHRRSGGAYHTARTCKGRLAVRPDRRAGGGVHHIPAAAHPRARTPAAAVPRRPRPAAPRPTPGVRRRFGGSVGVNVRTAERNTRTGQWCQ